MAMIVFFRLFGMRKSKWIKAIILGALAFFLWFDGTYTFLFGKILAWDMMGLSNILAKILAVILAIMAYDAKQTG